jgi:trehalose 6-phosphate phosphatase
LHKARPDRAAGIEADPAARRILLSTTMKGARADQPMQQAFPSLDLRAGAAATRLDRMAVDELRRDLALFLDIDGTLLDLAPTPQAVVIPDDLGSILTTIEAALGGALALVTGRGLADVDRLFAQGRFIIGAQHGAELRGPVQPAPHSAAVFSVLERLRPRLEALVADRPGLLLEDKGRSVALHYRQNQSLAVELKALISRILARESDEIELLEGKCVFEIKPRAFDKGGVVRALMAMPPFKSRIPLFIGDDETDRTGMATARALGGCAIRVGDKRDLKADGHLPSPAATRAWLKDLAGRLDERRRGP